VVFASHTYWTPSISRTPIRPRACASLMLRLKASFFSACLLGYQLRAVIEKYKIPETAQECSFQIALLNQTGLKIGQVHNNWESPAFHA
jgi:hypothetical protein